MLNSYTIKLNIKIMLLACTKNFKLRDKVLVKITFWLANYKHIQCILFEGNLWPRAVQQLQIYGHLQKITVL